MNTILLSAEDLRQFLYCPRILYFRHVLRAKQNASVKMNYGSEKHEEWRKKQIHRGLKTDRYFGIYLASEELHLHALCDAVDFDGKNAVPIELKTGKTPNSPPINHVIQIATQQMLIKHALHFNVPYGILQYEKKQFIVKYSERLEALIKQLIKKIIKLIETEEIPNPTPHRKKCEDCEFWKICYAA